MQTSYFSIRMHAGRDGCHLSGAEDLVQASDVAATAQSFLARALAHAPHDLSLTVEPVSTPDIVTGALPDLVLVEAPDPAAGRVRALAELARCGISHEVAAKALTLIATGAAPDGKVMRGALLIDARSGERLEADPWRGVRVSRFGWRASARDRCEQLLRQHDLAHFRTREALALAAKVLAAPGIIAELCWSDDPDYVAGYVASTTGGYLRIPHLKEAGCRFGGRAFFVQPGVDPASLVDFLEGTPFLITDVGTVRVERP